jgi:beta-mannosidase
VRSSSVSFNGSMMSSCNSSGDSTIHDEDEEEGAALLTESVVVTVDAVAETAAATTAATGGGSLFRAHISHSHWWRRILSPLILFVVVGSILAIAIIFSHAPNVNPVMSGIEEPFIDPVVVSPSEKQQQQHTGARDSKVVPQWQSIVPDTGFMYPLMGGNNRKHQWKLHSTDEYYRNISVKGEPGDIITDLMNAGIMEEPYFDLNFLKQRHIWTGNNSTDLDTFSNPRKPKLEKRKRIWVYETEFELPPEMEDHNSTSKVLVLEGIKMGARVKWNNIEMGVATDQFLRYTYTVTNTMLSLCDKHNKHKLSITFDPAINTDGRFAGYSGGWDWAAYMPVGDERGSRVWTFGIYKHMYIVAVENAYISHVVPKIYYQGKHPTQPMLDGPEADFYVQVDVHVVFPRRDCDFNDKNNDHLFLEVTSNFTSSGIIKKFVPKMTKNEEESIIVSSLNMTVSKDDIELWWPNGMGQQRLYPLQVRLIRQQREGGEKDGTPTSSSPTIEKRIGFRTAALVTVDDTMEEATLNQTLAAVGDGSGNHGMYFRVNGAMVWARGGNMIPMDQLEGRLSDKAHRELVQSTAAAHMNMLRVWGGGMLLPDSFYNACDEEGILLYHDMLFVLEHQHDAIQHQTVTAELKHTIRSLTSHPSIVLWSGCNECDNLNIFASYVMRIVADEDDTRAIWPNSPSKSGWGSGVNTLDGLPNGEGLTIGRDAATSLEGHGPYQHSFSRTHPTVNSVFA